MTYVKCAICKKEKEMKDLKLDKSKNIMVCNDCYSSIQNQINTGMNKSQVFEDDFDDFSKSKNSNSGFFSKIKSFFSSPKTKKKINDNPITLGEDISAKRTGPIFTKDEPVIKKPKVQKKEKVKYLCNKCLYKFSLRQNTRIRLCPMCGSKEIEPILDMDANSILKDVDNMR